MNPKRLAEAINTIAVGLGELQEAILDTPTAVGSPGQGRESATAIPSGSPAPTYAEANDDWLSQPSLADESVDFAPQGHEAVCPKHHVPYTEGQYGPYCKQVTDDPAWGKQKGDRLWCRISPKNAAEYLRVKAAA